MSTAEAASRPTRTVWNRLLNTVGIPILAIITALLVASIAIIISGVNPLEAYAALADGAFGSQKNIIKTLVKTTPFILAGLGIALAFRGGLFNIGVEGQLFAGAMAAAYIGFTFEGLPIFIHLPLALIAGTLGGAAWASIPGMLKAWTGAHEVITTIMSNFIAVRIVAWMIATGGPLNGGGVIPETPPMLESARMPRLIPDTDFHWGIILAFLMAGVVYWLLWRTTMGFEIRTVGSNPNAARYAGINVERNIILTMVLSGALAGLAGSIQVVSIAPYTFATGFSTGYGFDSIAVAVLGNIHPAGVVLASILFGAMDAGAGTMQLRARIPIDIIVLVQGLILMLSAAHQIIRGVYRIRTPAQEEAINLAKGWGGGSD